MARSFKLFLHCLNIQHGLGTHEHQANGMHAHQSFLYIKWPHTCHQCDFIALHTYFSLLASDQLATNAALLAQDFCLVAYGRQGYGQRKNEHMWQYLQKGTTWGKS